MFTSTDAGKYLFHYTKLGTMMDHILPNMQLRMSPFSRMNDPRESKKWNLTFFLPADLFPEGFSAVEGSLEYSDRIKGNAHVVCFTRDDPELAIERSDSHYGRGYAHPSLWDRYAEAHSGVCLAFNIKLLTQAIQKSVGGQGRLLHDRVAYADMPSADEDAFRLDLSELFRIDKDQMVRQHLDKHAAQFFFCKSLDWKPECEYRWVLLADSSAVDHYVDISGSLRCVIFGDAVSEELSRECRDRLREVDIGSAQMRYINGNPHITDSTV